MDSSDLDPDRDRIQKIIDWVMRLAPAKRRASIERACEYDPALISEVLSQLAAKGVLIGDSQETDVDSDELVGQTVGGRYLVERRLAEGGMGRVYLALDQRLDNRRVVIKILSQASLRNPDLVQRFKQEAVALSRIKHPCIVGVLDAGELSDGTPYIVLEYVDGETLRSQILGEGMEFQRVGKILEEIGVALDHVHEKEIFHRDLKPENIMIERGTGSVIIVDFGVAKVKDSALVPITNSQVAMGTIDYMSPEQLSGGEITAASDIYSMAVVAHEMITGHRPFKPGSAMALLDLQRAGVQVKPIDLRRDLSPEAQSILLKGLSFKPESRYATAGEFGSRLARALSVRGTRLKPWAITAVVLTVFALLSVGTYKYIKSKQVPPSHALRYWLTVQKTRAGQDYQQPLQSSGEETFASGDKFQLNVSTDEPGYLYIFNEGPPESASTSFTLVYPNQKTNNASSSIGAHQPVQSGWITFRGPEGAENFWIVWSASPIAQLEEAKAGAFEHPAGGLTDQNLIAVREFLRVKESEIKVRIAHYETSQTVLVSGRSEMLIAHAEFKHH